MLEVGSWCTLRVVRLKEIGVYLTDGTEDVLLPKKYVPEELMEGDSLSVFIYRDSEDRKIATTKAPLIEVGKMARLKVKAVTDFGAFMDCGLERDVLLPFKEQTAKVRDGAEYLVRMYRDKSDRLAVSMKLYNYLEPNTVYEKGARVSGIVYEYKKGFGALVAIDDRYSGLIHESEIFEHIEVGTPVQCRVVKRREDGKTDLAMRESIPVQMNEDSEMVYDIIKSYDGVLPFTDKADPERIKTEFGLSKNAFKRAVGHLLKEKKIEITEDSIRLL